MFELPRYVIHAGEIVVEDGEIRSTQNGRLFHVAPEYDEGAVPHIREWFERYYTIQFGNYPVDEHYLHENEAIACGDERDRAAHGLRCLAFALRPRIASWQLALRFGGEFGRCPEDDRRFAAGRQRQAVRREGERREAADVWGAKRLTPFARLGIPQRDAVAIRRGQRFSVG